MFLLSYRSRELTVEIVLPLITALLMLVKNILVGITFLTPVIVALAINGTTRSLLIRLVEEKSGRYKETFKVKKLFY